MVAYLCEYYLTATIRKNMTYDKYTETKYQRRRTWIPTEQTRANDMMQENTRKALELMNISFSRNSLSYFLSSNVDLEWQHTYVNITLLLQYETKYQRTQANLDLNKLILHDVGKHKESTRVNDIILFSKQFILHLVILHDLEWQQSYANITLLLLYERIFDVEKTPKQSESISKRFEQPTK